MGVITIVTGLANHSNSSNHLLNSTILQVSPPKGTARIEVRTPRHDCGSSSVARRTGSLHFEDLVSQCRFRFVDAGVLGLVSRRF